MDYPYFPVRGQAYRIPVIFRDQNGAVVTNWTGATATVCTDQATWTTATPPMELPSPGGVGFLDLTAQQMDGSIVLVVCTISNPGAQRFDATIRTVDLTERAGRETWLERMVSKLYSRWFNKTMVNQNQVAIYKHGSTVPLCTGTIEYTGAETVRSDLE